MEENEILRMDKESLQFELSLSNDKLFELESAISKLKDEI